MKHKIRWILVVMLFACLLLAACGQNAAGTTTEERPVKVEHLQGANPTRLTLTADAVKRLDIQTAAVQDGQSNGIQRMVIPYAAILYDTNGNAWVYTNPEPFVFLRSPITVEDIEGDQAYLSVSPSSGSVVVTVGAAELFGSETEFEEE